MLRELKRGLGLKLTEEIIFVLWLRIRGTISPLPMPFHVMVLK
jgi:hypothetical protein